MNHKWKDVTVLSTQKEQCCINCDVHRRWVGGNYQSWEYWWDERFTAQNGQQGISIKKSFSRPDCKPTKLSFWQTNKNKQPK